MARSKETVVKKKPNFAGWTLPPARPALKPVSDEVTPYGARKFRTPISTKEFTGTKGSPQEAIVLDIDETLQTFGQAANKLVLDFCECHHKRNPSIVFLVVTARTHEHEYRRSFNWLMNAFPYIFIGPFCRAKDDPRYASEFKRELAQGFEDMGLYRIVGAADDNAQVNDMWKHWKKTRYADFDLLECDPYAGYDAWRASLPAKSPYTYPTSYYGSGFEYLPAATKTAAPADEAQSDFEASYSELPTREALEDIAGHANPTWTPAQIEAMTDADLREAAGITNGQYRDMLYDEIAAFFKGHYWDDTLDTMDIAEIEPLMDMTYEQIEAKLEARETDQLSGMSAEERQRRNERMDLEDLARQYDDTLSLRQAEQMDSKDLMAIIAKATEDSKQINAGEVIDVEVVA